MSEPQSTGYGDSPDTTDGPVEEPQEDGTQSDGATLTTDAEAQKDDSVARPGNESD
jgi:hypothetical protein